MDARMQERRALEADMRVAIQEGQFEVHYQPLLDLVSDRITCLEALIRWRHPTRGLIAPADFIPIAEDSSLIDELGAWALQQACRDATQWPGNLTVSVNVSNFFCVNNSSRSTARPGCRQRATVGRQRSQTVRPRLRTFSIVIMQPPRPRSRPATVRPATAPAPRPP